ncbi:MAG: helix-turn-helix transcriptional regulator [Calditrichaeota bacterium]|nr:helix-turn-helix transcriptional regulator [Calditrichota bacterium]
MANLTTILKQEITRLARKELRAETEVLKKAASRYRADIADLKRKVAGLEQQLARQNRDLAKYRDTPESQSEGRSVRFSAAGLKKMRDKKDLSAAILGKLLGVTAQTVYNWEAGTTRPRPEQVASIASLRSLGKRELKAKLASLPS